MRFAVLLLLSTLTLHAQQNPSTDKYRPRIHFSPLKNWTNDPCGLYFLNGQYHVFFQHNPYADTWGHMSWGHATSRDLLHWTEHPIALPEDPTVMMFTGSAVYDQHNTSGLCPAGKAGCPILIYTGHQPKAEGRPRREHQNLAAALDRDGLRYRKYERNPVLDENREEFRDPKVFWHTASNRWIMVVSLADQHKVGFYASADLKSWTKLSEFGPAGSSGPNWECPEFFELPVQGGANGDTRWILKIGMGDNHVSGGSGEQYFTGRFDGTRFTNDNPPDKTLWFDFGRDCYCALAWGNQPPSKGIRMLGWMNNWSYAKDIPTAPFRGQMTIPREVSLIQTRDGLRLSQAPLLGKPAASRKLAISEGRGALPAGAALDLSVSPKSGGQTLQLQLRNAANETFAFGYDAEKQEWFADRRQSGQVAFNPKFASRSTAPHPAGAPWSMRVVIDTSSVEIFAAGGQVTLTDLVFPNQPWTTIELAGPSAAGLDMQITRIQ